MKTLNQFLKESRVLTEGLSSILYHYSTLHSSVDIAKQDKFTLSPSIGTKAERSLGGSSLATKYYYYFSMARSRHGRFTKIISPQGVFFELDGKLLATKYKGEAVDYWGHEFRKVDPQSSEMEDRIFSNDPDIEDAHKYIKSISVQLEPIPENHDDPRWEGQYDQWRRHFVSAETIETYAKKYNIPFYAYTNEKDFKMGNTRKADTSLEKKFRNREPESKIIGFIGLLQKSVNPTYSGLTNSENSMLKSIQYGEGMSILSAEIHGGKKANHKDRADIDKLISLMKKMKIAELSDAIELVRSKWNSVK